MKLTNEERSVLQAVRSPVCVHSPQAMQALNHLATLGFVEVGEPLAWQKVNPPTCPLGIAVITASGRRALNTLALETANVCS